MMLAMNMRGDKVGLIRLYRDLADGGASEFLCSCKTLQLGDWHPRQILKTAETTEQQRMSGDSVSQWSQACIDADAVIGAGPGLHGMAQTQALSAAISVEALRQAYSGFCKQNGLRTISTVAFGKACAEMFGPRTRLPAVQCTGSGKGNRPWGYHVPDGDTWQDKVDARLGIKH